MLEQVLQAVETRKDQAVSDLMRFLAIPSISAKPLHQSDMRRAAEFLADRFTELSLDASVLPTGGHPVVLAKNKHVAGRATILFYGHYDVQPPEPLDQWKSPPFQATVRDGAIYARGAVDDKGQVWAHIEAIAAWQKHGGLPVNLTVLIEGEEEVGSENLAEFLKKHKDSLAADVALISDTDQFDRGVPAICYGLRGLVYMEVTVTGPDHDLHSGLYGGAVANPANVLCRLLATLHDSDGRVNIPGFYDAVLPLTAGERQAWAGLPFDQAAYLKELNAPALDGEAGFTTIERSWARPTCDINGLTAGYQGPGAKTIIGATASAKVSMRLVPRQKALVIRDGFIQALQQRCPKTVKLDVRCDSYADPVLTPTDGPAMDLARQAVAIGFGVEPVLIRSGGSIPVVSLIKSVLGIDTLLVGFGLPDDRVHAPNEKFDLQALLAGSRTAAALYDRLSRLKAGK